MRKFFRPDSLTLLRIRLATLADISMIMAVVSQAPTAAQWPREHYERAVQESTPRRVVLVLEDKVIKACLIARAVATEMELENIAVKDEEHRRGLGTLILQEFLAIAKEEKSEAIFLEVRESNQAARSFYEKHAFAIAGRRSNYYANPTEDALVYRRAVS
jgi:ribosomal-protein-alanine N-acetyltransferase